MLIIFIILMVIIIVDSYVFAKKSYVQTSQTVYYKPVQLMVCHYYFSINHLIISNHNKFF